MLGDLHVEGGNIAGHSELQRGGSLRTRHPVVSIYMTLRTNQCSWLRSLEFPVCTAVLPLTSVLTDACTANAWITALVKLEVREVQAEFCGNDRGLRPPVVRPLVDTRASAGEIQIEISEMSRRHAELKSGLKLGRAAHCPGHREHAILRVQVLLAACGDAILRVYLCAIGISAVRPATAICLAIQPPLQPHSRAFMGTVGDGAAFRGIWISVQLPVMRNHIWKSSRITKLYLWQK